MIFYFSWADIPLDKQWYSESETDAHAGWDGLAFALV